jgi:hypothetical protein
MKFEQIKIILFNNSASASLLKLIFVNLLLIIGFIEIISGKMPNIALFLLSFFLISEIFIRYGIGKIEPFANVKENSKDKYNSFTKNALLSVLFKKSTKEFIKYITKFPQTKFILEKAVITKKELTIKDISLADLSNKAFEVCLKLNGKYVTTGDLLTAYLLLTENETGLLFNKRIKEEDLLNINNWSRINILEEAPR